MVSAYFKNIGQTRTLIQLIQDRSAIQQLSGEQMKEKELREAESRAKPQTFITEAELSINIQSNQGKAEYERSRQEAARIQTLATAEAEKIRILGEGEAKRIQAIAGADAERTARVGMAQRWRSRSRSAPTAAHDCS